MQTIDIENRLEQTPEGYWVLKDESHLNGWIREEKRLDHDRTIDILSRNISLGSIAIDVGANIGTHTCQYLQAVGEEGAVIAYEPHPAHFECLSRNCPRAIRFNVAVSDKCYDAFLIEESNNTGMSFLSHKETDATCYSVKTTTLDYDWINNINSLDRSVSYIKIDVEGYEAEVLWGAKDLISRFRPILHIEVNNVVLAARGKTSYGIHDFIEKNKYKEEFICGGGWYSPQTDILCRPL